MADALAVYSLGWQDLAAAPTRILTQLQAHPKLTQAVLEALSSTTWLEELERIERAEVHLIAWDDERYPELLKHISYPPPFLYVRGNYRCLHENAVGIVGARKADHYGRAATQQMVSWLKGFDYVVVSGGARGIDTMAHESALQHQLPTVAILGSGLSRFYPSENKKLFERIVEQEGALVSPFPMLMGPMPQNFPARNRIIAGLSQSLIVVQGERTSGAGITATFALEQGKAIFALPGTIDNSLSALPHYLISQGATIITGPESFGVTAVQHKSIKEPVTPAERLLHFCGEPKSLDELIDAFNEEIGDIHQILFQLQCAGKLQQDFTGRYVTN